MDICWTRASAYEAANRNKGPFVRPVTTSSAASVNHPFSKVAGVHAQVSRCGAVLYTHVVTDDLGRRHDVQRSARLLPPKTDLADNFLAIIASVPIDSPVLLRLSTAVMATKSRHSSEVMATVQITAVAEEKS